MCQSLGKSHPKKPMFGRIILPKSTPPKNSLLNEALSAEGASCTGDNAIAAIKKANELLRKKQLLQSGRK
jgi:hypothetical protein